MNIYYQDILERIRLHYQEMTDTEKLIARFFLDNQKKQDFSDNEFLAATGDILEMQPVVFMNWCDSNARA